MDIADDLAEQVRQAAASAAPLSIRGGGSKSWLGRESAVIAPKELPPAGEGARRDRLPQGEGGRRDRLPQDAATKLPSPLAGEGLGERGAQRILPVYPSPLPNPLMKLLANRLSPRAGKSLVIPQGEREQNGRDFERYATTLNIAPHNGIVDYDPRELVLTARAGTPLREIEAALSEAGQMLAFEPPHWGAGATLGGTIACGLSGPRRPHAGSARDFLLGCELLNGRGERLRFGGRVMKNVAGYDVSRLMAGAYGTLGVLLEISLKVLPRPAATMTLAYECAPAAAIQRMNELRARPLPIDAAGHYSGQCYLRLSGSQQAVSHAYSLLGGEPLPNADNFWENWREHRLRYFDAAEPLYRIAVKPATPPIDLAGDWLIDWAGGQRWLVSAEPLERIRETVGARGGHVTLHRGGDRRHAFHPLPPALLALQQRLKASFDPGKILNRGRMYAEI